ncbi:hypothetical protein HA466_0104750 [Hirschfeldia incana]|nr:hypothetical protein HA466_0104750 [Hirschfeldia incana]
MGPRVGEAELLEAGKDLLRPYSSTDSIFDLLIKFESLLFDVDQNPIPQVKYALRPSMQALVSAPLLRNPDPDVRVYVVSCLTEIMRITAPEPPYNDVQMKEIFEVTVEAFGKLADPSCYSYKKAEAVLDIFAKVRSSLVMLDLECDDLILEMCRKFCKIISWSPDCPQPVLLSMETIMVTVIDESEEVSMDLLKVLLSPLRKKILDVSPVASRLVEKVLSSCACKLRPYIKEALKSTGTTVDMYSPVISSICQSEAATTEAHIVGNLKETGKLAAKKASFPSKVGQKDRGQHGLAKTSAKKSLEKSAPSYAKKKNSKDASMDTQIPESSKSKKKNSLAMRPSTKESEQTLKSHSKRKRTAVEEVESNKSELGEELVGERVKVWWPLDKKFYDGVIKSYSSLNKMHQVSYSDGDSEELNLKDERWEIISEESNKSELGEELVGERVKVWWPLDKKFYDGVIKSYSSLNKMHQVSYSDGDFEELNLKDERWEIISEEKEEIDLPRSTPLSDIMLRHKAKKRKIQSMNVEPSSSSEVRFSKKKDLVTNSAKQGKATKDAVKGGTNEPERREEINLKFSVDCYDKGESETKGEDSLEIRKGSNAEPECKRDQQEPPEDCNAEAKSDGEELKSANKATAEPKFDGKEPTAETKSDGHEQESAKEPNEEPETDGDEIGSVKDPTADTKLIEEDSSEEKQTGKVDNEAEKEDKETRSIKQRRLFQSFY